MAKRCVSPSCYEIVRDGTARCETHTIKKKKEVIEGRGPRRNAHIYDTRSWRNLSRKKRSVDPFCEDCWDESIEKIADVVDHIVEIEDGGKPFLWSNLKSLCHYHHNNKTAKEKKKRRTL